MLSPRFLPLPPPLSEHGPSVARVDQGKGRAAVARGVSVGKRRGARCRIRAPDHVSTKLETCPVCAYEAAVRRKVDLRLLPILGALYAFNLIGARAHADPRAR